MGAVQPGKKHRRDLEFGWPMLRRLVDQGIGQAIVVREGDVIAVEAAEGTTSMIRRAGKLCRRKGWVVLKTSVRDGRSELPEVTVETIETLAKSGGSCLGLGAGRVRLADKPTVLGAADRLKIAVVGIADASGHAAVDADG